MTTTTASEAALTLLPIASIDRNPENPRILFRQGEMEQLLDSIRTYGIQVPISVYREGKRYVLIDGERRWRCSLKLNRPTIPALVQVKPTRLENLLLMFNIHALREQWDLLTIALKLPPIIEEIRSLKGQAPTERELAAQTGLNRAVIRRSKLLLELPAKYRDLILDELGKPKPQQKLTEDFFIEMERALKTVENRMPDLLSEKDLVRDTLIDKYRRDVIPNRTHFRKIGKIARAENVEADESGARGVLLRLFQKNDYSIERAFEESVSEAYLERDLRSRIEGLIEKLALVHLDEIDDDLIARLRLLVDKVGEILRRAK